MKQFTMNCPVCEARAQQQAEKGCPACACRAQRADKTELYEEVVEAAKKLHLYLEADTIILAELERRMATLKAKLNALKGLSDGS